MARARNTHAHAHARPQKPSKAQKRREKAAAKDAEREARIAAELAGLGPSEQAVEEAALAQLLAPRGLGIKEIRVRGMLLRVSCAHDGQLCVCVAGWVVGLTGAASQRLVLR
jgi:hypothetical protein